jgi:hypothetical protein
MSNVVDIATGVAIDPAQLVHEANWASRAARLAGIKAQLVTGRRLTGDQRFIVAQNLWRILDRYKQSGISPATVLQAAGKGRSSESTKRLPYYAINPHLPDHERERRRERLTQKASKYVDLIDSLARVAQLDRDSLLVDLFDGSGFGEGGDQDIPASDREAVVRLSRLLRDIGLWVSRTVDLSRYWESLQRERLSWSSEGHLVQRSHAHPAAFIVQTSFGYEIDFDWIPKVNIGRKIIDSFDVHYNEFTEPKEKMGSTNVHVYEEVFIGLAPISVDAAWAPVFVTKRYGEFMIISGDQKTFVHIETVEDLSEFEGPIVRVDENGDADEFAWMDPKQFSDRYPRAETNYLHLAAHRVEPLNELLVYERLFSTGFEIDQRWRFPIEFGAAPSPALVYAPVKTIAAEMEMSCLHNAPGSRLHDLLLAEATRKADAYAAAVEGEVETAQRRDSAYTALIRELRSSPAEPE